MKKIGNLLSLRISDYLIYLLDSHIASVAFVVGVLVWQYWIWPESIIDNLPLMLITFAITLSYSCLLWFTDKKTDRLVKLETQIDTLKACLVILLTLVVLDIMRVVSGDEDLKDIFICALAIFGTVISLVSWREAFEQNREIKEIRDSLPTHYIGSFPNHLKDIITLINDAKESICILADCVDYGSFSNPDAHERVVQAIEAVQRDNVQKIKEGKKSVTIQIRVCGEAQAISRSSEFWDEWQRSKENTEEWEKLRDKNDVFQKRLAYYCKFHEFPLSDFDPKTCSQEQFRIKLMERHEAVRIRLGVEDDGFVYLEHMPGLFFWMKDDKEAVFVLSHTGPKTQGIAFFTRDIRITEILKSAWDNLDQANKAGRDNVLVFDKKPSITNFLKLFPNVKREQVESVLQFTGNRRIAFHTFVLIKHLIYRNFTNKKTRHFYRVFVEWLSAM